MNPNSNSERQATLVRYLLDELSEEERNRVEEQLLVDRSLQEDLAATEEELVDVFAELPPEQRILLERKFSGCPEWRETIGFTRLIERAIDQRFSMSVPRRILRWRRWPMVALASAAMVLAAWMFLTPGRKPTTPTISPTGSTQPVPSFLLTPVVRNGRGAQSDNVVQLPPGSGRIELRLQLDHDYYPGYEAQLRFLEGGQPISLGTISPMRLPGVNPELRIALDSTGLKIGRYTIVIQGTEPDGRVVELAGFSFRLARQERN